MKKLPPGQHGPITISRRGDRWTARCTYRTGSGARRDVRCTNSTQTGARDGILRSLRLLALADSDVGLLPSSTLQECAVSYLASLHRADLSEESMRVYRSTLNKWIINGDSPVVGWQLEALVPNALSTLLHNVGVQGGVGAAKMLRTTVRHALGHAVQSGVLVHNPAREATFSPRAVRREQAELGIERGRGRDNRRSFTRVEEERLFGALADDEDANRQNLPDLVHLLSKTGMRIGEGCRTTSGHLHASTRRLDVPGTKSIAAARTIAVPVALIERFEHREGLLAPAQKGGQRDVSNSVRDMRAFLDQAGFPWATSHTFRRTVATKLDEAGFTAREIADHLGHAHPSLTQDAYLARGQARDMSAAL